MKKRLISILLALTLSFSLFIVSGSQSASKLQTLNATTTTDSVADGDAAISEDVKKVTFNGTHIFTAPERTDQYIVKEGRTNYKIIVPYAKTIGKYTKLAASELVEFFRQATGITLSIIYESEEGGYTHNETDTYFSIGHTKLLESSGIDYDSEEIKSKLMFGGCRVVTKDNNIYMFGATDEASAYAVYDFLQITLNYEYYALDCWEIDEGVRELKMRDFDVTDIPDAAIRDNYWGYVTGGDPSANGGLRYRSPKANWIMPVGDTENGQSRGGFHNTAEILPKGYGDDKWQSDDGSQLCYTAHGDKDSYDAMVAQTAHVLELSLKDYPAEKYPDYHLFTITIEDTNGVCTCPACAMKTEQHGQPAGQIMVFCNDVMAAVTEWWDKPENAAYKRDNFYLMFFAYAGYVMCPATYDPAQGKYVVNDPELELRDDVGVYFAANNVNYFVSIYDEKNDVPRENALAWFDVAPVTYLWLYEVNFSFYPSMWDTFDHFNTEGYQFWMSGKPLLFLNQAVYDGMDVTGFQGLKVYLDSKLQWDCSLDSNVLTDKWFDAMFGQASSVMRELYNDERVYTNVLYEKLGGRDAFSFLLQVSNQRNWSLMAINKWLDLIERARLINDTFYKEGMPETWERINHHIDQEFVFPGFLMVNFYDAEVAGPRFYEVAKYFQDHNDVFSGYTIDQSDAKLSAVWNSIKVN